MIMFSSNKPIPFLVLPILITFFTLLFSLSFSAKAQTASCAEDLVKTLSDGKLQVETRAIPYKLVGDFNGDKIEDLAVIVI